jgi:HEAT repeats
VLARSDLARSVAPGARDLLEDLRIAGRGARKEFMGLFDLFRGPTKGDKRERGKNNPAAKWADRIEKRVQNYDRQEAIQALADMASAAAATVLLKRFTFHMDPSITDQEEKDAAFRGILRAGKDAIEPVRAFAAKAESLAWPMKIMKELVGTDEYVEELLRWLSRWDTEYAKFVDPKVQILTALEEQRHPNIREGIERFLEDVNEPARFHAVSALLAQEDPAAAPALANLIGDEESVRVRTKIADGLAQRGWVVPAEDREAVRKVLPSPFALDAAGRVIKR